jgi:phosphoribosylaminoimidazole carboxylase PurE protein
MAKKGRQPTPRTTAKPKPVVGVVMGSDSDLATMRRCTDQLDEFAILYELRVISAHRTPDEALAYAATAARRGLKVIVAAAGMSAALSGVLAGKTTLPVVGVPVAAGPLVGVDAALSTLQMPPGVPVGCMSIGSAGAMNAAIFAAEILATSDAALAAKLRRFKAAQARRVSEKDAAVRR